MTWVGGGAITTAAVAAFGLNLAFGESVFAARLVAGLANCL